MSCIRERKFNIYRGLVYLFRRFQCRTSSGGGGRCNILALLLGPVFKADLPVPT